MFFLFFLQFFLIVSVICLDNSISYNSVDNIQFIGRQPKDVFDNTTYWSTKEMNRPDYLMSVLVKNALKIFDGIQTTTRKMPYDGFTSNIYNNITTDKSLLKSSKPLDIWHFYKTSKVSKPSSINDNLNDTLIKQTIYLNSTKSSSVTLKYKENILKIYTIPVKETINNVNITKDLLQLDNISYNASTPKNEVRVIKEKRLVNDILSISDYKKMINTSNVSITHISLPNLNRFRSNPSKTLSCIECNNIKNPYCYNPKKYVMPTKRCKSQYDLCYSLHTPFAIIDRGCFNPREDVTIYVCQENLCNGIPVSEMPILFSIKEQWISNVKEMTRLRKQRKSLFKDMKCLKCEINLAAQSSDFVNAANCFGGNIDQLSTEKCNDQQVCGIKSIISTGYIWRGCIDFPLYNYWMILCDNDICNFEELASIFDK